MNEIFFPVFFSLVFFENWKVERLSNQMLAYFKVVEKPTVPDLTPDQKIERERLAEQRMRTKKISGAWLERAKLEWKLEPVPKKYFGRYSAAEEYIYIARIKVSYIL